jgi:hypothetical protein
VIPPCQYGLDQSDGDGHDAQKRHLVDGIVGQGDQIMRLLNVMICGIRRADFLVWKFSGSIAASMQH